MTDTAIAAGGSPANSNVFAFPGAGHVSLIHLCREHDRMWSIAMDEPGGSAPAHNQAVDGILTVINSRPADSLEAAVWRGNLLARCVINGWGAAEVARIAEMVQQDAETMGIGVH